MSRFQRSTTFYLVAGLSWLVVTIIIYISFGTGLRLIQPDPLAVDHSRVAHLSYQDVSFPSRDKSETLKGWLFSVEDSDKTIVFAHDYKSNRLEERVPGIEVAQELLAAGYNVLLFDLRKSGESTGSISTFGFLEQLDVLGAVDFILEQDPNQQVALFGFGSGGATVFMNGIGDERIKGVIADSTFAHLPDHLRRNLPVWTKLPTFPFSWFVIGIMPMITGLDPEGVSPLAVAPDYRKPILLLHGQEDKIAPANNPTLLAEEIPNNLAQVVIIPGAPHLQGYATNSELYMNSVLEFLKQIFD